MSEENNWIDFSKVRPCHGKNVIGVGTWYGEVSGCGENDFMCIGCYNEDTRRIEIDTDTYETSIIDITHWLPLPPHP